MENLIKLMLRHINILNILLIFILIGISIDTYRDFLSAVKLEKLKIPSMDKKDTSVQQNIPAEPKIPSMTEYVVIAEKNLFHPDRKLLENKEKLKQIPKIIPDIVVYGTIIEDNFKVAFIEDKRNIFRSSGRGIRQKTIKIGDEISGYKVKDITENSIVLTSTVDEIIYKVEESSEWKHKYIPFWDKLKKKPKKIFPPKR